MLGRFSAIALLALSAGSLAAQGGGGRGGQRRMQPGGPPPGAESLPPTRAMLEQRVQQRLGQVMKQRLGLTDPQMKKLQETNRRFDEKRRILVDQERDIRMSLRDEMARPDSARQGQVSGLLDRMTRVQHQRVDLMEQEQKELGTFLTPLQRANYLAAEENIRQRMQQMRQQRMNGGRGQPPIDGGQPDGPPPQRLRRRPFPPNSVLPPRPEPPTAR